MGNSSSQCEDVVERSLNDGRELDISSRLTRSQFYEHLEGDFIEDCLSELPASVTSDVSFYEKLNASFNAIGCIPPDLPLHTPHLRHLNLSHNCIQHIPESVALLFHLEEFYISHNLLTELPRNFVKMRNLSVLDVSYNSFSSLPPDLGSISTLTKLNVSCNLLSVLPASLGQCPLLSLLLVEGNRLLDEECDAESDVVLQHLRAASTCQRSCVLGSDTSESDEPIFVRHNTRARDYLAQLQAQTVATGEVTRTPILPPAGSSLLDAEALRHALSGLLVGAVLGDALGMATESMSADQARFYYDRHYRLTDTTLEQQCAIGRSIGEWTVNSDLVMLVLDSVVQWAGVIDELDLAQRLTVWNQAGQLPNHTGDEPGLQQAGDEHSVDSPLLTRVVRTEGFTERPHLTARSVAEKIRDEMGSDQCVDWDSCLPAALVCGVPRFHDVGEVCANAQRVCLTCHSDAVCVAGCVTLASIVAQLLQGGEYDAAHVQHLLRTAVRHASNYLSDASELAALEASIQPLDQQDSMPAAWSSHNSSADVTSGCHGNRQMVLSVISACAWCLRRAAVDCGSTCWRDLVTAVTLRGGRAAVTGCVCGAVLGTRLGHQHLPSALVRELNPRALQLLHQKLNHLMDLMAL